MHDEGEPVVVPHTPEGRELIAGSDRRAVIERLLARSVGRDSLVGGIAEWVGRSIIEGRLAPGDDLNAVDLARRFHTSRTPVREALVLLEKEGLVDIPPRRRPRVARMSIKEVREIYQIRATLYALVAELIVATASDEAIGSLRPYLDQMTQDAAAGNAEAFFWTNVAFRDAESDICGNALVKQMLDSLGLRTLHLRHFSMSLPGRMERTLVNHQLLLQAYMERDAQLAMALRRAVVYAGLAAIERSGWPGLQAVTGAPPY